jgi:hypothetical protein
MDTFRKLRSSFALSTRVSSNPGFGAVPAASHWSRFHYDDYDRAPKKVPPLGEFRAIPKLAFK